MSNSRTFEGRAHALGALVGLSWLMLAAPVSAGSDPVLLWNEQVLASIRAENTPAPLAARNLAILHVAMADAVTVATGKGATYHARTVSEPGASLETVALEAGHVAAAHLYPSRAPVFDALAREQLALLSGDRSETWQRLGAQVAQEIIVWRAGDGSSTTVPYIPHSEPGQWRRTAPYFRPPELVHWRYLRPFLVTNLLEFLPPGPPALGSETYARDVAQVRELGRIDSPVRTPDQTQIARFWSNGVGTVTPPGHWNQMAAVVSRQRGLTLAENARLFAVLNVALADAGIATWECKFRYNFWRPVTAIERASEDGNPDTLPESGWTSLILNPAFPEYVSGHSTFSGAGAEILASYFGGDEAHFTLGSDSLPGVTRSYTSFSQAAQESGISRIYGGIHFMSSNRDGLKLGHDIAHQVWEHQPALR